MPRRFSGCEWERDGFEACDLSGERSTLCQACLRYLLRLERPADWSPRVKRCEVVETQPKKESK